MTFQAAELAHRLARDAEAVCRHNVSNDRRQWRHRLVGDIANQPGRTVPDGGPESGNGAAGKCTDSNPAEHGDMLDLIARSEGLDRLRDVLEEARSFLSLSRPEPT
jgi:hypothetical protein